MKQALQVQCPYEPTSSSIGFETSFSAQPCFHGLQSAGVEEASAEESANVSEQNSASCAGTDTQVTSPCVKVGPSIFAHLSLLVGCGPG